MRASAVGRRFVAFRRLGTVLRGIASMGDGFCVDEVRRRDGLCVDEVRRLGTALVSMRCVGGTASC